MAEFKVLHFFIKDCTFLTNFFHFFPKGFWQHCLPYWIFLVTLNILIELILNSVCHENKFCNQHLWKKKKYKIIIKFKSMYYLFFFFNYNYNLYLKVKKYVIRYFTTQLLNFIILKIIYKKLQQMLQFLKFIIPSLHQVL